MTPTNESTYTTLSTAFIHVLADLREADRAVNNARLARDKAERDAIKAVGLHHRATQIAGGPNAMVDTHLEASQQHAKETQAAYERALASAVEIYHRVSQQWYQSINRFDTSK
jgi:uncharacterized membrane protein YccC